MPTNRVIYNALALFVSSGVATGLHTGAFAPRQLSRVQSFDDNFTRNLIDANQFGDLAAIQRIDLPPDVTANLNYLVTNGSNENRLGLFVTPSGSSTLVSALSGILTKATDEKNLFLAIAQEGFDFNQGYNQLTTGVVGVGNATINNYTLNLAVGELANADVSYDALHAQVYASVNGANNVPAITPSGTAINVPFTLPIGQQNPGTTIAAIRPGDIEVTITGGTFGFDPNDLKIQSVSLDLPIGRSPIEALGNLFPRSREIDFPVTTTLTIDAQIGDRVDASLLNYLCSGTVDIVVTLKQPACGPSSVPAFRVFYRGALLSDHSLSATIGDNASATFEFQNQIAGIGQTGVGVFFSGTYTN